MSKERMEPVYCRYDPEIHTERYKPWLGSDERYLIENYGKIPLTEISLSMGRTYRSVQRRVYELRKKGIIRNVT